MRKHDETGRIRLDVGSVDGVPGQQPLGLAWLSSHETTTSEAGGSVVE